eukprot:CAMPEP_0206592074 /NCGR_PEP_ID=MMETSP0325_2-20121206/40693_1 /ASSEMBLY_ACC=CAM_ASM_000347 /TAXON_ID=2866 /ORGANISM="Crypthecodinium cohnii, Strain Seligo" /LENGTH=452 /DNA_ID=CAMNT_0054101537 /DNA_START=89 /DNA_END=1443 /DNA_ORIENTATION=-
MVTASSGIFFLQPLDCPDKVEQAAANSWQAIKSTVLDPLQIDFERFSQASAHALALTNLAWFAAEGEQRQKSVCVALLYALLLYDLEREGVPGYYDYLCLLRSLDQAHGTAERTLASFATKWRHLTWEAKPRLLALLQDMADARWGKVSHLVMILQREFVLECDTPEDFLDSLEHLRSLVELTKLVIVPSTEGLIPRTLIWTCYMAQELSYAASVWPSAAATTGTAGVGHSDSESAAAAAAASLEEVTAALRDLARALWEEHRDHCLEGGVPLLWAATRVHNNDDVPAFKELAKSIAEADVQLVEQASNQVCVDHLLFGEEQEQVRFIVDDAAKQRRSQMLSWYLHKKSGWLRPRGSLADSVLWLLLRFIEIGSGDLRLDFWEQCWSGEGHRQLAEASIVAILFAVAHLAPRHDSWPKRLFDALLNPTADPEHVKQRQAFEASKQLLPKAQR